ncbi:eIF-2-alpha kinase activator GCN1 [Toxorhynchites rutilus septentrionalis]|uniref:eIF-2-alpha kinase activator GCN1 n=1 Tax=Toxorhynchites rutilus septentrionalis TaxID=329112 RepID=UPI002478B894|nr:eIF-2-alpha kinase activator GCN1 [Toxorhynchites rutilus septentrionalis]
MADSELAKALKDLPNRVLNSSVEDRPELFRNVIDVLPNPGINATIIRGICKVIGTTLTKYKDPASQMLVRDLIVALLEQHPDLAYEHFNNVLKTLVTKDLAAAPPLKGAQVAILALGWANLIALHANHESAVGKKEFPKLIENQAGLYQLSLTSGIQKVSAKAYSYLKELFAKKEDLEKLYFSQLISFEPSSSVIILMSAILRYSKEECDNLTLLEQNRTKLLDHIVKGLITVKIKPHASDIVGCSVVFGTITKDEFKATILPALQRSMLRSPEVILRAVGSIVNEIQLDISDFVLDLGKTLVQNLASKDETVRQEAAESLKQVAMKCSAPKAIESLLKDVFAVLNGSGGKITIAELRINLLQGAGNLSYNRVSPVDIHALLSTVAELFTKTLETELQEKVLCHALEMFGLWSVNFHGEIPAKIVQTFKKGLESKAQVTRTCYLQWFLACLRNGKLPSGSDFTIALSKIVEKAAQNPTQSPIISEAIGATCVILLTNPKDQDQLKDFWNVVLDMNKKLFLGEKFLSSTAPETLCYVMLICERLMLNHLEQLKGSSDPIFKAIIYCVNSHHKKVRQYCLPLLKNIVNSSNGIFLGKILLQELTNFVEITKILNEGEQEEGVIPAQAIVDTIMAASDIDPIQSADAQTIALHALLSAHHSAAVSVKADLWESILQRFELDGKYFISMNLTHIREVFFNSYKATAMYENTLATLSHISPEVILPVLVKNVTDHLNNSRMSNVTDEEYFTYLTPDGELYDKSVIPNSNEQTNTAHLKRENKAYSYKEQLEELQLRREIEEKRQKEGKSKPPQLTPKQKEAIEKQTEKEKAIKNRLKELNNIITTLVSQIEGAAKGTPRQLSLFFPTLLPAILRVFSSPLAAPSMVKLYLRLKDICFPSGGDLAEIGRDVAIATIRLSKPHCDLEESWCTSNLLELVSDILVSIYDETIDKYNVHIEEDGAKNYLLNAPAFSYCFELLKRALVMSDAEKDESLLINGIQIIAYHTQLKGDTVDGLDFGDLYHPRYMPRLEMIKLLLRLIQQHRGRVQTQAVAALLDVAESSSGKEYTADADQKEIECLMVALQDESDAIRDVALRALAIMINVLPSISDDYEIGLRLTRRLWVARHDVCQDTKQLAENLWQQGGFDVPIVMADELLKDIIHPEPCIQKAASFALVTILTEDSSIIDGILEQLLEIYQDKLTMIPAKLDQFDREVEPAIDPWSPRRGVAIALCQIAPFLTSELVNSLTQFMVATGLRDREEIVHKEMLAASLAIVEHHGKESVSYLLPTFEEFLDKAPNNSDYDNIRQAVVILMGSLARHLDRDDARIQPIVNRLLAALSTPSQQVQESVANCIPHLIPSVKDQAPQMVKRLMQQLVKSEKYGVRKGAAYGIAGIVKGLGILSLKQLDIMTKLTAHIQDKKNFKCREGALFAFEMLCSTLGRLFEPYIVHVLPHLLQCFGDSSSYVREAADECAKTVMAKLSAHGVKLILPSLLNALDEDSWRTKTASVELLGAMAYCAPKQLSSCLPSIVPKLMEVLGDSHIKVQEAGADALRVIGSVIKNPEIQAIVPVLLKALENPSTKTSACLQSLLETKFVHFIDAPSLALIMPVVQRAFMDRSTETRKMAAQIIGNMYSLTDQKDLTPYLPNIIPGLKTSLLDPVPEVRAVSSRALGAMVKGMGESSFDDLLPWLMQTLTSESSSVDRSGAAQGLSEVVGGLGVEKLHKLMPEIIATAERTDIAPHVKDGYIMMFIYMPSAFPNDFMPYIGQIINPILKALADENEYVRDTALKAGQRIVNLYAESAIALLLPELEKGLFDDNWRIRYSSVQLLGDLLYKISGVSGKMTTQTASEDDNFGTEQSHKAIIRSLGAERRNRVLAGLYMGRSDVSLMVRQAALHVWKVVVTNTPRTLREILPTLFSLLLGCLASTSYDKRQVAARTLGDLVRKLGERVLPEIIPILERGLNSDQADQRQGVCIGLSEIMASTSRDMVLTFVNSLVPTVRKALADPLPEVRQAAAKTFDSLHNTVGTRALDDILPSMLESLSDPDSDVAEWTLDGLRQVMAIKSRVVLPYLIPQLTAHPVNTKALSILASVAGDALTRYLPKILPALLSALATAQGTPEEAQELEYCQAVILSVSDEVGVRTIMDTVMESSKSDNPGTRKAAATLLCAFCTHSPGDYSQYVPQLLRGLLRLLADSDRDILQRSWDALNAVTKTLDSAQQIAHVTDVRQAVKFASSDLKQPELPGFCLPKGITPLLPVFREAILNGLPEEKENAAQGLGEVIQLTSATSLQPSVVHITGPLIRILGDRFNAGVKAAVLETLAILLHKVGIMLKQFLPQLQTTFLKALHDPNRLVRIKSGHALAELIVIHTRPDPLFVEMHNGIKNTDDSGIRETMLQAMRGILTPAGDKMTDPLKKQIYTTLVGMLGYSEDVSRAAAAGCFGALCRWLSPEQLDDAMGSHLLSEDYGEDAALRHGRTAALFVSLKECPAIVYTGKYEAKICKTIISSVASEKIPVALNGVRAAGYLLQYGMCTEDVKLPLQIIGPFVKSMNHTSNEVKQLMAKTCIHLAKVVPVEKIAPEYIKLVIPMLVNGTKEKNGYVKSNSEIALVHVLRLREGDEVHQKYIALLEPGARDSLSEVVSKVLRKVALQPVGKEEELDDTILT